MNLNEIGVKNTTEQPAGSIAKDFGLYDEAFDQDFPDVSDEVQKESGKPGSRMKAALCVEGFK